MSRSRPASNPLSYHKQTGQYYITRAGKRIYLGAVRDEALEKYHRMNLGLVEPQKPVRQVPLTAKELATGAARNCVSFGAELRSISGDDSRAEAVVAAWPSEEDLKFFTVYDQRIRTVNS